MRRPRFALRTLLLVVAFCAIPFAYLALLGYKASREEKVLASLTNIANAQQDYIGPPGWHELLETSPAFIRVVSIRLTDIDPTTLDQLGSFDYLVSLSVANADDTIIPHFTALRQVAQLDLSYTAITDKGLAMFPNLPSLEEIILDGTAVTDGGMRFLARCPQLKEIGLNNTRVTDTTLRFLCKTFGVRYVDVRNTDVTDKCVEAMKKLYPSISIAF